MSASVLRISTLRVRDLEIVDKDCKIEFPASIRCGQISVTNNSKFLYDLIIKPKQAYRDLMSGIIGLAELNHQNSAKMTALHYICAFASTLNEKFDPEQYADSLTNPLPANANSPAIIAISTMLKLKVDVNVESTIWMRSSKKGLTALNMASIAHLNPRYRNQKSGSDIDKLHGQIVMALLTHEPADVNLHSPIITLLKHIEYGDNSLPMFKILLNCERININGIDSDEKREKVPLLMELCAANAVRGTAQEHIRLLLSRSDLDIKINTVIFKPKVTWAISCPVCGQYNDCVCYDSALSIAIKNADDSDTRDIVKLIIAHPDCDVNLKTGKNTNRSDGFVASHPIELAFSLSKNKIVKLLLEHERTEFDINKQHSDCDTLLHDCIEKIRQPGNTDEEYELMKLLLEHPDINVNIKNSITGCTALMHLVSWCDDSNEYSSDRGNAEDSENSWNHHIETQKRFMKLLCSHADINLDICDSKRGKTAFMWACPHAKKFLRPIYLDRMICDYIRGDFTFRDAVE